MTNKNQSKYTRKNGVTMRQINISIREDIAEKFELLCDGLSKSAILTQWINEKVREQLTTTNAEAPAQPKARPTYSILGD